MEIKAKSVNSKKILNENIEIQVIEEEKLEDLANIKYMYGEEINKFEDRNNEFKECKGKNFDISTACLMISSYVSAFLNTEGGTIYYGVADNGLITGIKMNRKGRDLFTQSFDNILNKFRPAIGPSLYRMNYAPVYNKQRKVIPDLYVIEIEVTQGDLDKIYFTHKEEAFVKRDSSVSQLKGPSLLEFSRLRQA